MRDSRFDAIFVATVDDDRRPFVRAECGDREADPLRRSRDEDGLARQLKIHEVSALMSRFRRYLPRKVNNRMIEFPTQVIN